MNTQRLPGAPPHRPRRTALAPVPRAVAAAWAALWATTALGALAVTANVGALRTPAPHDALAATLTTTAQLIAHNAIVAPWPLALTALGWADLPGARRVGDALIAAQLLGHGLVVGGALASHPDMWRYLPHLPAEWLALAIPAGTWVAARTGPPGQPRPRQLATAGAASLCAVVAAAVLETYLVPL